jgi:hypothetical protein
MTDPRYAARDVTDTSAADRDPSDTSAAGKDSAGATSVSGPDPQATTELPRADRDSASDSRSGPGSEVQTGPPSEAASDAQSVQQSSPQSDARPGSQSATRPAAGPSWSSDETHDFPAYRPQSYPTYPPTPSQTTELPVVGAGGPPPTAAAAYGGGSGTASAIPAAATASPGGPERPRRRAGAGLAGALGVIGLAAAAYGAFALPVQKLGPTRSPYFTNLRQLSTHKLVSSGANAHSVSFAGGHAATLWWRYGLAGALGVLTLLLLIQLCVPVLRRVAGVLLFLGGLATIAGYAIGIHQTNDYRSIVGGIQATQRLAVSQLGLGIWVAVAGCAVASLGGLIATVQSTRR